MAELRAWGLKGIPEVQPGDDLAALIIEALRSGDHSLAPGDVLVVTQKIVSKAEGRLVDLDTVEPSHFARQLAEAWGKDPAMVEVVLRESRRIVRMDNGVIVAETRHGFVCANAGVDASNVAGDRTVALLPLDPDASAARLRAAIGRAMSVAPAVVISDSFGRPWREGTTEVAIGVTGMPAARDYIGVRDAFGYELRTSVVAVADELACVAELVCGKIEGTPVALIRGYDGGEGEGKGQDLVRAPERDLFR
ncbi:MAG TPA: coenzyme F420-0:L-glutamate ligase [Dehalococcoidia bacterium]|nr:coenzyme F420-0:L-glutamate ligase [Dehalococcoidia bacterium]